MTALDTLKAALADRYEIDREIGSGGMATVYLARDLRHDRLVALKLLRPELGAVIGAERFLAEIKLTANLQHSHILPLFDSGAVDGLLFYVMPYVEGVSVRERLNREKQLSIAESVRIATEVASALDYAHRRGVIHRDIKPENILLHDGQALVADFGIALAVSTAGTRMTETGMSLGTPHYMSPEQAMGEREITARSDVYALGAVTYEMLAGEPPFTGPTAQSIVAKVLTEEPRPLLPKRHTIPRHVELAVLTALEKLPADRFATAAEFSDALNNPGAATERQAQHGVRAVSAVGPVWKRPAALLGAAALAAVALGIAVGWAVWRGDAAAPAVSRFVVTTPTDHRLTGAPLGIVSISPDGRTLVYVGQNARGTQLYQRRMDQLGVTPIAGTEGGASPFFTPDGRWLMFTSTSGLRKIALAGGAPVVVPLGQLLPLSALWLDDNTLAMTAFDGNVYRVAGDGSSTLIASPDSAAGESTLVVSAVDPDSRTIFVIAAPGAGVTGRVFAVNEKSGECRLVLDQNISGIFYGDGHLLWVDPEGTLLAAAFDIGKAKITGVPVTLAQGIRISVGGPPQMAISRNGTLVYVPQLPFDLMLVERSGRAEAVANVQRRFHSPRFSPDGRRIALDFTLQGSRDVWTLDLRDRALARLTFANDGHDPVWLADGKRIAYASARNAVIGMFLRNADGSGAAESLYVGPTSQTVGASPPGMDRVISIVTGNAGSSDLAFTPLSGDRTAQPFLSTRFNESYPAVSPDGRWLAYVSDESGQSEVYIRPLTGSGAKVLVSQNGGSEPVWSRDGRELFYRGFSTSGIPLIAVLVQTTPEIRVLSRTQLFDASEYEAAAPHANYDVGPDGRFVLVYQGRLSEMVVIQNWTEEVRRRGAASK